ncbi:MAG TPA: hypothetical protein VF533_03805 [Solirubrobacteraceae bacterium]|jgi:hypothetical protein
MPLPRLLLAVVVVLAAALQVPATAAAGPGQLSIFLDDDQMLYRGDQARDFALQRMKTLGADVVRVSVLWSVAAENAHKGRRQRRRFRSADPSTYPIGNWDRYDRLVLAAQQMGIVVYLDVTGPGPKWAMGRAPRSQKKNRGTWKPDAREFGRFVRAVATRYSGAYRDENGTRGFLPKVTFWALYNEPNQGGWLTPQYQRRGGKVVPWSPVMYRSLWLHGRQALEDTGHDDDIILIGETAPLGSGGHTTRSPIRPKKFIRELFCVRSNGRRYRGRQARLRRCSTLKRIKRFEATAWAHHPYTKKLAPTKRDRSRDSISIANVSDLPRLLDQMASKTRRIAPGMNTMMTEFGYETNPPDPFSGVSLAKQAAYINIGDHIAYQDPRVVGQTQFLFKDVPPVKGERKGTKPYWFTYQSGLFDADGRPKPAATAYAMPLVVTPAGDQDHLWGQLRFLPNGRQTTVATEFRAEGSDTWAPVGEPIQVTNGLGFYEADRPSPGPGAWRAVWSDGAGFTLTSREVTVD